MTYFQNSWANKVEDLLQAPWHQEAPPEVLPCFCSCWAHGGCVQHRLWLSNPNLAAWLVQHWHIRDWHRDHTRVVNLWLQWLCLSPHKYISWREYLQNRIREELWACVGGAQPTRKAAHTMLVLCALFPCCGGVSPAGSDLPAALSWAALHHGLLRNTGIHSCCWISAASSPQNNKQLSSNFQSIPKLLSEPGTSQKTPSKDSAGPAHDVLCDRICCKPQQLCLSLHYLRASTSESCASELLSPAQG